MTDRHFQVLDRTAPYPAGVAGQQARTVAAGLSGLVGATLRPFAKLVGAIARARRERIAMRELNALDDRVLSDIGISRGQIPAVVASLEERRGIEATPARASANAPARGTEGEMRPAGCNVAHACGAA